MAVISLNASNFDQETAGKEKVLIDFWASWCGPCKMLAPVVEQIGDEAPDGLKVCKVNIDEEPELAARFGVMSIPTLVLMENGEVKKKSIGLQPKDSILKMIELS